VKTSYEMLQQSVEKRKETMQIHTCWKWNNLSK